MASSPVPSLDSFLLGEASRHVALRRSPPPHPRRSSELLRPLDHSHGSKPREQATWTRVLQPWAHIPTATSGQTLSQNLQATPRHADLLFLAAKFRGCFVLQPQLTNTINPLTGLLGEKRCSLAHGGQGRRTERALQETALATWPCLRRWPIVSKP